jgi:hypothetical protein
VAGKAYAELVPALDDAIRTLRVRGEIERELKAEDR